MTRDERNARAMSRADLESNYVAAMETLDSAERGRKEFRAALREAEGQRGAAGTLCVEALYTDGAHHKQWYLEEVLKALGFDLDTIRAEQMAKGYGEWEEGMVP